MLTHVSAELLDHGVQVKLLSHNNCQDFFANGQSGSVLNKSQTHA